MKVRILKREERVPWIKSATAGLMSVYSYATGVGARMDMIVDALTYSGRKEEVRDLVSRMSNEERLCCQLATLSMMLLDAVGAEDGEVMEIGDDLKVAPGVIEGLLVFRKSVETAKGAVRDGNVSSGQGR